MAPVMVTMVAIGVTAALASAGLLAATAPAAGAAGRSAKPPAQWDHRIVGLVHFVEQHRKLRFEHPIPVRFLADAEFKKRVRRDDVKVTTADRRQAQRAVEQLRAIGLLEGAVDLIEAEKNLSGVDTVGYYDQDKKEMVIRGTDLKDTETRVTVVHELTHAVQDQHFDLTKLDDATRSSGAETALTALVEGDATRIEDQYVASLPQSEQDAYDQAVNQEVDANKPGTAGTEVADVPPILGLFDEAPYDFGEPFVDTLAAEHGTAAIDGAFRHPPTTDQEIIDPVTYFASRHPLKVAVPKLDAGEKRQGSPDDFGALALFVMLDARLGFERALQGAEAWGGDRSVDFRRDGHTCVRVAMRGRTDAATKTLATALTAWAAAGPSGAATVETRPALVTLTACDLGGGRAPSYDTLSEAVNTMAGRVEIISGMISNGAPPAGATCVADRFVTDPSLASLLQKSDLSKNEERLVQDSLGKFVSSCGGG